MKTKVWVLAVVILTLLAASLPPALADGPVNSRAGRSEVRFLEGMIDHHQMALDMAADCLKKAKTDDVRKLCQAITDAQGKEIKTMRGWLLAWYQIDYNPMSMTHMMEMMGEHKGPMMGGMHMGSGMMQGTPEAGHMGGMMGGQKMPDDMPMMMGMMAGLSKLEGTAYEVAWMEAMIDHHDDAVHMSERILKNAEHKELRDMAAKIIQDQTAEIAAMESLLKTLNK
ncbi:MAG: DUF305 domain-containing protein [Anaerolineae bacterium]|nr:DUF305 domain-containing protein [Anaerolineae bacterium]